jgi:ribulose-phosphate 3-epimerase
VDDVRRPDPKVPVGNVVAQDPPPGTPSRPERSVRVWLRAGVHAAELPMVTGQSERTAQLRLTQDGLEIAAVSEIRSATYPADVVVAQEPPAKTPASRVALLVNRSEQAENYVMPDLIGVNGERAAEILPYVDLVLVMSVNPGFGGQSYIPTSTAKIARIRRMIDDLGLAERIELQVDGGVAPDTIAEVAGAGATVVVAGSAVYNRRGSVADNLRALREAAGAGK